MGLRLSASGLHRARLCAFPFSDLVRVERVEGAPTYSDFAARTGPRGIESYAGETGHAFASMRENYFHSDRPVQIPQMADAGRAATLFKRWLAWFEVWRAQCPADTKWESEVPFAFDPRSRRWRRLPKLAQRGYESAAEWEVVGTADVVGWMRDRVVILDDKTGKRSNVTPAKKNEQLAFLATAAARVTAATSGLVGLVFPAEEPEVGEDFANVRADYFFETERWLVALAAERSRPDLAPRAGDHCFGCVVESVCPAKRSLDDTFAESLADAERHPEPMARRPKPEETIARDAEQDERPEAEPPRRRRRADDEEKTGAYTQEMTEEFTRAQFEGKTPRIEEDEVHDPEFDAFAPPKGKVPADFPPVPEAYERIVETIYRVDFGATHEKVERSFRVGEGRSDYATLNEALDNAEDVARVAFDLYLHVRWSREKWLSAANLVMAKCRQEAIEVLQAGKEKGDKRITEADVDAKMATMYSDEVAHYNEKVKHLKGLEEKTLHNVDQAKSRCRSLQVMIGALRR